MNSWTCLLDEIQHSSSDNIINNIFFKYHKLHNCNPFRYRVWASVKNQFKVQCNLQKNIKMKDYNKTKIWLQEVADIFWAYKHQNIFRMILRKIYMFWVLSVAMF